MSSNTMEKDVYKAAVNGDLTIFSIKNHEELVKKTHQNKNIIHIAAQHKQINFIKAALNSFHGIPTCESLICDKNCHGNTPLHIAAQVGQEAIIDLLYDFFSTQCTDAGGSDRVFPWRMVNSKGNTPAHVALLYGNVSVAMNLVDKDGSLARFTNHSKETLLHLAIQFHVHDNPEMETTSSKRKVYQHKEDLWPIIELLLKMESSVACWANADGLTPLHRAASLDPTNCIQIIKAMLASCPEAAEVHDERSEQTILHLLTNHQVASYKEGIELLQIPEVHALIDIKDDQGDTPLHLAAKNRDKIMVRVLLVSSAKIGLKNNSGVSASSLLQQLDEIRIAETPVEDKRELTNEECEAALQGNVAFLNEQLVSLGITFLVSETSIGGNILHLLLKSMIYNRENIGKAEVFIGQAIQKLPSLITQQDRNGNTLVHLIAGIRYHSSEVLNIICRYFQKMGEEAGCDARDDGTGLQPWRIKNVNGNMPFLVAISVKNYKAALKLLEMDEEVAHYVHKRNQNPLHLISHYDHGAYHNHDDRERLINYLININGELPYMQDEDGLTPLLVAVQQRRSTFMITKLWAQFPACIKVADFKGRTIWHLFVCQPVEQNPPSNQVFKYMEATLKLLIQQDDDDDGDRNNIRRLMESKDNDGNTPLHLAIKNRHFDFAQFFLENYVAELTGTFLENQFIYDALLSTEDKEGRSCYNLIGSAEHLPRQFAITLFKNGNLLSGHRSMYGVPTTKIEAYANTIGVIAALLATITFTAAFTVPGGLNSNNGTPLLLQNALFQLFMVADVVAMCTSMMVLFCLLWIMTTSNKAESISLLDISVFLLQTSIYATLVTFMTGLFVTTISIVPAIAISTCVACTSLIILMHRRLVMFTVVPFCEILIILGHVANSFFTNRLSPIWSWLKYLMPSRSDIRLRFYDCMYHLQSD